MPKLTREQLRAKLNGFSISDLNKIGLSSQETNMQLATVNLDLTTSSITKSSSVLKAMQSGLQQSQQFIANAEQSVVETDLLLQQQQKEREEIKQKADHAMQKMQRAKP